MNKKAQKELMDEFNRVVSYLEQEQGPATMVRRLAMYTGLVEGILEGLLGADNRIVLKLDSLSNAMIQDLSDAK
tara:strand:- start:1622 stop:1843 length:222 start_codon:yes stop_codon:yes gene_type:complete